VRGCVRDAEAVPRDELDGLRRVARQRRGETRKMGLS
jgi:hypothetical protein